MDKNVIKVLFWVNAFFFVSNLLFVVIGAILFGSVYAINIFAALVSLAGAWAAMQMQES